MAELWTFAHPLRNVTHSRLRITLTAQQLRTALSGMSFALYARGNANRQHDGTLTIVNQDRR